MEIDKRNFRKRILKSEILSETGRNYWKARWDDCNNYFFEIAKTIPKPVKPEEAFYMFEVQKSLKESYK